MSQFFTIEYHLAVTVLWLISYIGYRALLTRTASLSIQRAYLLCTVFLVPLYPLWALVMESPPTLQFTMPLSEVFLSPSPIDTAAPSENVMSIADIAMTIYIGVSIIFLTQLLWRMWTFRSHERFRAKCEASDWSAASYFTWIYIDEKAPSPQRDVIQLHETAHVRLRHSIDKLLLSILSCFFWYHPMVILLRKSLDAVHEYQADASVLQSEINRKFYAELLISMSDRGQALPLAISFHHSIKQRLIMMYNNHTPKMLGSLLSVAILAIGIFISGSLLTSCFSDTQDEVDEAHKVATLQDHSSTSDEIFKRTEEMPLIERAHIGFESPTEDDYKLSQDILLTYIYENIKYPDEARKKQIEGLSVVQIVIDKSGNISGFKIAKSLDSSTDAELERLFDMMKKDPSMKWRPGMQDGKPYKVEYTIPVRFKLAGSDKVISVPASH